MRKPDLMMIMRCIVILLGFNFLKTLKVHTVSDLNNILMYDLSLNTSFHNDLSVISNQKAQSMLDPKLYEMQESIFCYVYLIGQKSVGEKFIGQIFRKEASLNKFSNA